MTLTQDIASKLSNRLMGDVDQYEQGDVIHYIVRRRNKSIKGTTGLRTRFARWRRRI